jgi:putative holliday junction resolvase
MDARTGEIALCAMAMIDDIKTLGGKVMALDLGDKRIGVAISDATRTIASPHSVINRRSRVEDVERYIRLIDEQNITLIVVGLPVPLSGIEGQHTTWVRDYAANLSQYTDVPVIFWDESLTTREAEAALRAQGRRGKQIKQRVDAVAAALILQSYLDAQRGELPDDYA